MAEGVLFDLAGKLLERLASSACREHSLAWGVKAEIDKVNNTVSFIKAAIRDAEEQQRNKNHEVKVWLQQLKEVLYDVDDLLDDFSTEALRRRKVMNGSKMVKEVRIFFSKSNQIAYSFKMGHRVKAIRERLDAIADDRAKHNFSDRPVEPLLELKEMYQTHSYVVEDEIIGRDGDKRKIVELLVESKPEENVSVVPIIGIGGLGKTTLAKMVFNDEKVGDHFQLKMWVCVSQEFELKVIVENIIEVATKRKLEKGVQMELLQEKLRDIIDGEKYLLVLDDVWNENPENWLRLRELLLGGARGSWIVITTRSGNVAKITGTTRTHELEVLSESQSCSLLKKRAFREKGQEFSNSRLDAIGMEIVEKCKGVPLALRTIGSLLFERTEAEWLRVKNNVPTYITQEEGSILPILKLSYDHLPSHLRQCFAYCSVFPKNTQVEVKPLIILWMALGFIHPLGENEDLEVVGREYVMDLIGRSLFQVAKRDYLGNVERFRIHDLMHDLARSVSGTECCCVQT